MGASSGGGVGEVGASSGGGVGEGSGVGGLCSCEGRDGRLDNVSYLTLQ